jgi:drug/metabolite transporter (DMT)-like permease
MLAIYIIWGSTYLAIRFAIDTIPPFMMAATRFLIPGLILVIWRRLAGDPAPTRPQWLSAGFIGILLLVGGNGLLSWAEKRIDSGIAAILIGTVPIWMVIIDAIFVSKKIPRLNAIIGLLAGFSGIVLLVDPLNFLKVGNHPDLVGFAVLLLAAFFWSSGSVYTRKANLPSSPLLVTGMEMLVGSVALFLLSLFSGEWRSLNISAISVQSFLGLLYLIIAGSLVGFVAYTWLLKNAPISLVSTYAYVNPLIAILLGHFFASEVITVRVLIAAGIIISSVILINYRKT